MRLIDAVNVIIEALGETRTTDINSSNPTVGLAISALETQRRGVLATGFWFNTIYSTVTPASTGLINIPWDQLSVYDASTGSSAGQKYGVRDGVLYDLVTRTKVFTDTVTLRVILDFDFEDLPEYTALWVAYKAAAEVYMNDLGQDGNYTQLLQRAAEYQEMNYREHLRNQRYSSAQNSPARRIARGFRI